MDTFDMERLEVLEGPAGVLFGRGSTGGVVNYVSKAPSLSPLTEVGASFSTDGIKRASVDFNRVVADATALRINVVGYDGGVADRDRVNFDHLGIAPSISFGLGTDTRLTLSFLHQSEYDLPDYGVPWIDIGSPGAISRPALVPRHNFYGFNCCDFARSDIEIGTVSLAHDFNDGITIRDQFRYGSYAREFRVTEPGVSGVIAPRTPLASITAARIMQGLRSSETFLDNQTEALLKFASWEVQHRAVLGLEIGGRLLPRAYSHAAMFPRQILLTLSRQSRNQTGGRKQNSSSAVRAILDDPPIHIRPVCSRTRGCEGQEPCGFNAFQHAHGCTPPPLRPQDSSQVLSRVSS